MMPSVSHVRTNGPELWLPRFPWPAEEGNKYDRGHAIIAGGPIHSTGASRLSARAALRSGAGLVSIACDAESLPIYATALEAIMTKCAQEPADFARLIAAPHVSAVLLGPGAGVSERTRSCVLETLRARKPTVLDADALTVFAGAPSDLFGAIHAPCLLTPHAGEFTRLFGALTQEDDVRLEQVRHAAGVSGATVVLKGPRTFIVAPTGEAVINAHATPFLATAGTGDVLAGFCTGLLAQGMPAFEAACAGVWLHGEIARQFGPGLIAEDLADLLPPVLRRLYDKAA